MQVYMYYRSQNFIHVAHPDRFPDPAGSDTPLDVRRDAESVRRRIPAFRHNSARLAVYRT